jgi:hypothetical protein
MGSFWSLCKWLENEMGCGHDKAVARRMEGNYQRKECTGMKTLLMKMSDKLAEEKQMTVAGDVRTPCSLTVRYQEPTDQLYNGRWLHRYKRGEMAEMVEFCLPVHSKGLSRVKVSSQPVRTTTQSSMVAARTSDFSTVFFWDPMMESGSIRIERKFEEDKVTQITTITGTDICCQEVFYRTDPDTDTDTETDFP